MTGDIRAAFTSLDEMLEPGVLSQLLGRPVTSVHRQAFEPAGWSSTEARFEGVRLDGEVTPSLVAKTVRRAADWVALMTHDTVDREVRCWESGLLARLPAPATHAVVAAARTNEGYSVLMHDVSGWLLPEKRELPPAIQHLMLDALAAIHAEFWMDDALHDPALGLASVSGFIGHTAPGMIDRSQVRDDQLEVIGFIEEGWQRLPSVSDPSFAADVQWLAEDPSSIVAAAARYQWTLTHADARLDNLAVDTGRERVFLLDWGRPTVAPPALDLAYWFFGSGRLRALPHDGLAEVYAAALRSRLGARFPGDSWEAQIRLGLLMVFVPMAPFIARFRPEDLPWWMERVRPEVRALG